MLLSFQIPGIEEELSVLQEIVETLTQRIFTVEEMTNQLQDDVQSKFCTFAVTHLSLPECFLVVCLFSPAMLLTRSDSTSHSAMSSVRLSVCGRTSALPLSCPPPQT